MNDVNEPKQPDQSHDPRGGKTRASLHFVLNWTHMSIFIAVAALGLITLNQGFAGIDQRFDDVNRRFDDTNQRIDDTNRRIDQRFDDTNRRIDSLDSRLGRIETRLDRVEGEFSDINARLSVVEFIGRTEAESPTTADASVPNC